MNAAQDPHAAARTPPPRSLLTNSVLAIFGTGLFHGSMLVVLILLNKYATPAIAGQYLFALSIAVPVLLFLNMQLRAALVADAREQYPLYTYIRLRNVTMAIAAIVLGGVALAFAWAGERPAFVWILVGVFAARVAWSLAEVGWGIYQRSERLDRFALAHILRAVAALVPFAILLPIAARGVHQGTWGTDALADFAAWASVAHAAGFALVYLLVDRRDVRRAIAGQPSPNLATLQRLATHTLPLGLVALTINLCDSVPRWLLASDLVPGGKEQLGYFGSLAYLTMAGNLIVVQSMTAAANRLARSYQTDLRAFVLLGLKMVGLSGVIGVSFITLAIFFGRWFLTAIYTPDYAQFFDAFLVVLVAHSLALLSNVFGAATTQMRVFWMQVPVQVLTLLATVIAAFVLIPGPQPVLGAAYVALVRAIVQMVLYLLCVTGGVLYRDRILAAQGQP